MDTLTNKLYNSFDYRSRYSNVPYYYDTLSDRYIYGIGSNVNKDIDYCTVKLKSGDTLDKLALKYYGNPTLWWAIAYFNNIQDAFINLIDNFETIKIPAIASIEFGVTN